MGYVSNPGGAGGGGSGTTLDSDSRLEPDDPTAWPEGFSEMLSVDGDTAGTFSWEYGGAIAVICQRSGDFCIQLLSHFEWNETPTVRRWNSGASSWDITNGYTPHHRNALAGTNGSPGALNKYVTDSDPRLV